MLHFNGHAGHFIIYGWIGAYHYTLNAGFYHVSDGFLNVRWIFRIHPTLRRVK